MAPSDKDRAYGVKRAVLGTGNEGIIVGVDVGIGDVADSSTPVIGVVLPDDGAETKGMSDGTNTVVDVTKRRLSERVRIGMDEQGYDTDTPAGRGDAENEFDHLHLQRVSKLWDNKAMGIQLQRNERRW